MHEAYLEAVRAVGNSDPNPAVGAVLVSAQGNIIARGFTHKAGYAHAERHALEQLADADLSDATLYVTLEPCCHHGRTPPCVDIILQRKVGRVVIAQRDFAVEVGGRSVEILKAGGVDVSLVETAAFERESWYTTGPFFFARQFVRPRVTLKWAQTRDGAIAPLSGPSGAISGTGAAYVTAALRSYHKVTLATPGTVKTDAPRLTVRFNEKHDLSQVRLSKIFEALLTEQYIQATVPVTEEQAQIQRRKPAQLGLTSGPEWHEDFPKAMQSELRGLLQKGHNSVLIEAGPVFSQLLLDHDLVDALAVYRSKSKTAQNLWGSEGRSNRLSHAFAVAPEAPGFTLLEAGDLGDDEFFFFRRNRA